MDRAKGLSRQVLLYVALGAAYGSGDLHAQTAIEGFWFGLSKRSWTLT